MIWFLRVCFFYLGVGIAAILFALLGLLLFPFPFQVRYYVITRWSHFFIAWAKWICGLRYMVSGREHIPSHNVIVMSNHQSMWETLFMQVLFPPQSWILKRELLYIPFFGWGLALLEPIAINRQKARSIDQVLEEGQKRLKQGRWIVLFPEGTRVAIGTKKRYARSGGALSKASGYPILPIAHNAGSLWPRGFWIKRPGTIQIKIGPLIHPGNYTIDTLMERVEEWIEKTKKSLH